MSRARPRSDRFRAIVSGLIASAVAIVVSVTVTLVSGYDEAGLRRSALTAYVTAWPVYSALYVGWGTRVYSRLPPEALRRASESDDRLDQGKVLRLLHLTGTTNTTLTAAAVAVIVTVAIAQREEFRSEPLYILLALLTVASSWLLMVFSFAQRYQRLGAIDHAEHFRFHIPDAPRFSDYFTLATLLSTMAATVPADVTSRRAWLTVRTNVVIAFVFNSVIIAMMVSLLFGGLLT
ncbi:DUF1345 domain-containing protein [Herbiconiux sp. CPCC 205763]|uniref:DUF1345 domain-containing protein n=1 Tax=Herbiconiux aconitum TaxID=2970913 RepID=A0ABT2GNA7_9MICO|nr:DUF1345 domain-containing protein [Herbiconiux aconitum]MCS5717715.1 DUF1345 domain-containing protein [Herbiconiux aconitum]